MDAQLHGVGIETAPGMVVPPVCPFFRSVAVDGAIRPPVETPDGANRCGAYPPPRPQSALQQELVCLTSDHTDCPRYAQGLQRRRDAEARRERLRRATRPTSMAIGFLLVSFGFVVTRGGLAMPAGTVAALDGTASPIAIAAAPTVTPPPAASAAEASVAPTMAPTTVPTTVPTAEPTRAPTPAPTPPPTPTPTPMPTPEPTPSPTPRPTATPQTRYDDLEPCEDQRGCWVYIVRSGDSLWAIGERFGHSLDTVYEWNPWTRTRGLRPGAEILLPPPNR